MESSKLWFYDTRGTFMQSCINGAYKSGFHKTIICKSLITLFYIRSTIYIKHKEMYIYFNSFISSSTTSLGVYMYVVYI